MSDPNNRHVGKTVLGGHQDSVCLPSPTVAHMPRTLGPPKSETRKGCRFAARAHFAAPGTKRNEENQ